MANKVIDSDLQVNGNVRFKDVNIDGIIHRGVVFDGGFVGSGDVSVYLSRSGLFIELGSNQTLELTRPAAGRLDVSSIGALYIGETNAVFSIKSRKFIVKNGTASQFLKADGTLDSNTYALHSDLNAVKTNAWKLDEANAECESVVISLVGNQSVFERMEKDGIVYERSRNIYVDMSEADSTITDIFAGFENLPIGVRYHIFFGNTKADCKINWDSGKVESNIVPSLGLTPAYPTAKCEFMRVTDQWTYADWEAKIENVNFSIDTGTASDSDNSILMKYMDNNKISYSKTTNGALVNLSALLAALASNK